METPRGDAEHAFGGNPLVIDHRVQAGALVRDDPRHVRTGKGVAQKQHGHHHQRWTQRPSRRHSNNRTMPTQATITSWVLGAPGRCDSSL